MWWLAALCCLTWPKAADFQLPVGELAAHVLIQEAILVKLVDELANREGSIRSVPALVGVRPIERAGDGNKINALGLLGSKPRDKRSRRHMGGRVGELFTRHKSVGGVPLFGGLPFFIKNVDTTGGSLAKKPTGNAHCEAARRRLADIGANHVIVSLNAMVSSQELHQLDVDGDPWPEFRIRDIFSMALGGFTRSSLASRLPEAGEGGAERNTALAQRQNDEENADAAENGLNRGYNSNPKGPNGHSFLRSEIAALALVGVTGLWIAYGAFGKGRNARSISVGLIWWSLYLGGAIAAGFAALVLAAIIFP